MASSSRCRLRGLGIPVEAEVTGRVSSRSDRITTSVQALEREHPLHYLRLPKDISEDHVILMDSSVSTGDAVMMAVRVPLDHEVQEEQVVLVSLLMSELGVHSVAYAFPQVRIDFLDDFLQVLLGIDDTVITDVTRRSLDSRRQPKTCSPM